MSECDYSICMCSIYGTFYTREQIVHSMSEFDYQLPCVHSRRLNTGGNEGIQGKVAKQF